MYFKGALFLNTLRSVVNDDTQWWKLLRDMLQHFKYQNIMTEDIVRFFNEQTGKDLTPIFDQYLRHAALPTLELTFNDADKHGVVPLEGGRAGVRDADARRQGRRRGSIIQPTTEWKTMPTIDPEGGVRRGDRSGTTSTSIKQ